MALVTKSRQLTWPLGSIVPNKQLQLEITATLVILEAKNVPLNPPQRWGLQAKKDTSACIFFMFSGYNMEITKMLLYSHNVDGNEMKHYLILLHMSTASPHLILCIIDLI